ncbi:MAG TPA: glycosyltransferase [Sulfurovum sp.]|nr:glycosyltransferase [Sulfurovum sp.]
MKIVQLLPELNEGGVERGTMELSRELVKLGHESIVISAGGQLVKQIEEDEGKHIILDVCSKNIFSAPFRMLKLRKVLKELQPDILHARSRVPAWLTYLANKRLNFPFVTTVHGLNSINAYSKVMTKGDRVIAVSEVVRDYIIKGYGVNDNKITVIQRGVDTQKFSENNIDHVFIEKFKQKYALENKFIVTSVGRVTWLKDYETFIKSIAKAKEQIPNIVGLVVGGVREDKIEYFESLKKLAQQEGVEKKIVFTGSQTHIAEVYALSDILVNASLKMGNVARTVTESLVMNTPVIATTFEGLNNLIVDGVNGAIIETQNEKDLANKIKLLHDNMPQNVKETLPYEFTLQSLVESTVNVYKSFDGIH